MKRISPAFIKTILLHFFLYFFADFFRDTSSLPGDHAVIIQRKDRSSNNFEQRVRLIHLSENKASFTSGNKKWVKLKKNAVGRKAATSHSPIQISIHFRYPESGTDVWSSSERSPDLSSMQHLSPSIGHAFLRAILFPTYMPFNIKEHIIKGFIQALFFRRFPKLHKNVNMSKFFPLSTDIMIDKEHIRKCSFKLNATWRGLHPLLYEYTPLPKRKFQLAWMQAFVHKRAGNELFRGHLCCASTTFYLQGKSLTNFRSQHTLIHGNCNA